jgi:aldose 1-epimerase
MVIGSEHWAVMPDGQKVSRVSIGSDKLRANVITYGAILQDLRLSNWPNPLVLGYQKFAPYVHNRGMVGAIVGRYANRISKGMAVIGGKTHYTNPRNH